MEKIIITIAAVILGMGGMAGGSAVDSNSIVEDGIEYYIQTNKSVYNLGENVEMLYRVTNLGNEDVTFSFPHSPEWNFWVKKDGENIWRAVNGWWTVMTQFTLGPGDSKEFPTFAPPYIWDMRDDEDNLVNVGAYNVIGGLYAGTGEYEGTKVSVPIIIIPEPAMIYYVDADANGVNDGSSWTNAYNYLQDALTVSSSGDEIWVAQGIYKPDEGVGITPGDRTATFQLKNGVTIKGGYAGFGEPDANAHDIELYKTILSGDLSGDDGPDFANNAENSYHVVNGSETDSTAVLDSFIITGGNANSSEAHDSGAGMYNEYGNPTISNCTFKGNSSILFGGGMYNYESNPLLSYCTFRLNYARVGGGGIYNDYASGPTIVDCTFQQNSTDYFGGGIDNVSESSPTLINCMLTGNSSEGYGAGISMSRSSPTLTGCTLAANSAIQGGGGFHCYWSSNLTLINCTLSANSAPNGNAVACRRQDGPSHLQLTNCILWDGGGEIWNNNDSVITITYTDVQGGWPGESNIDADPCFVELGYWDPNETPEDANDDFWVDGDYHLQSQAGRWDPNSQTWVIDNNTSPCIDAGNPGCPLGDEPNDPNNIRINMGAYGGTAEASKAPANWRNIADLTNDWVVDFNDLKVFVDYWLDIGECIPSDLNRSQFVDFSDLAIFARQWSDTHVTEPGMIYQIDDCNMEAGRTSAVAVESDQTRFSAVVEGRYIHFEDMMTANCCPDELGLEMTVEDNLITIYETEYTPGGCWCICDYPVTATLGPFEPGTYILEVYEDWGGFIGSTVVTIGPAQ